MLNGTYKQKKGLAFPPVMGRLLRTKEYCFMPLHYSGTPLSAWVQLLDTRQPSACNHDAARCTGVRVQEEALALPPAVPLLTVAGQECFLPLHYNGMQLNGCVNIHGSREPSCWVNDQGWQVSSICQARRSCLSIGPSPCNVSGYPTAASASQC